MNKINQLAGAINQTTQELNQATKAKVGGKLRYIKVQQLRRQLIALRRAYSESLRKPIRQRQVKAVNVDQPRMSKGSTKAAPSSRVAAPLTNTIKNPQLHPVPKSLEQIINDLPAPPKGEPRPKGYYNFNQATGFSKAQLKRLANNVQGNNAARLMRDMTSGAFDKNFGNDTALSNQIKMDLQVKVRRSLSIANDKANRLKAILLRDTTTPEMVSRIEGILNKIEVLPQSKRNELQDLIRIRRNQFQK